jgi:hypothetical protein
MVAGRGSRDRILGGPTSESPTLVPPAPDQILDERHPPDHEHAMDNAPAQHDRVNGHLGATVPSAFPRCPPAAAHNRAHRLTVRAYGAQAISTRHPISSRVRPLDNLTEGSIMSDAALGEPPAACARRLGGAPRGLRAMPGGDGVRPPGDRAEALAVLRQAVTTRSTGIDTARGRPAGQRSSKPLLLSERSGDRSSPGDTALSSCDEPHHLRQGIEDNFATPVNQLAE